MTSDPATLPATMRAWATGAAGELILVEKSVPSPATGEVLVKVEVCGICRTDLHVIDWELDVHHPHVIPGHQVVGQVIGGDTTATIPIGTRVGIPWLRSTCGSCDYCRSGRENLCELSQYTGWDADGGYAEFATVPAAYCYPLDPTTDPLQVAPLLCAGIIGYRALQRAQLPPGGILGIYGFGSSAHITAQLAMAAGAEIYVMSRGEKNRELAAALAVAFVGEESAPPPKQLDSAIIFAPAGNLVPVALTATAAGGTVVVAGIHLSDIPSLSYESTLFHERDLRSVTSNTRADGAAFLRLAHSLDLKPVVTVYSFQNAVEGINDLRRGDSSGSLVIDFRDP